MESGEDIPKQERPRDSIKRLLRQSLTNIPQLGKLDGLNKQFMFGDQSDTRDIQAFVASEKIKNHPYGTTFGRSEVGRKKKADLFIGLYTKKVDVNGEEIPFGRLEITCNRHGLLGSFQTVLNFRRLGDRYLLELGIDKIDPEWSASGVLGPKTEGERVPDSKLIGILKDISSSLGTDENAKDFMVRPLNGLVTSFLS